MSSSISYAVITPARDESESFARLGRCLEYLVLRSLPRASIEIGAIWGYVSAWARRRPRCPDEALRAYLRRQQHLRNVPQRRREALGRS